MSKSRRDKCALRGRFYQPSASLSSALVSVPMGNRANERAVSPAQAGSRKKNGIEMMRKERGILIGAMYAVFFAGCASSSAPKVKGHWNPVNRFAESTEAIPLRPTHEFYALPVDGTLKNLLQRWANDSGRTLSYLHGEDFTLHAPVARIRTTDLSQAASELSAVYAGQSVQIEVEPDRIVVFDAKRSATGEKNPERTESP